MGQSLFGRRPVEDVRRDIQARMSRHGAHVRVPASVEQAAAEARSLCGVLGERPWVRDASEIPALFRNVDLAIAHAVYLEAVAEYIRRGGESRGSYVVLTPAGAVACPPLGMTWRFNLNPAEAFVDHHVLEVSIDGSFEVRKSWVPVRPIPKPESWFETVWQRYRDDEVIR
jgi:hypothetical protein